MTFDFGNNAIEGEDMPRRKKEVDTSGYKDLGVIHWRKALEKPSLQVGVMAVSLEAAMLSNKGFDRAFINEKSQEKGIIHYDREFVLELLYKKMLVPLHIVYNGIINHDGLNKLVTELTAYTASATEREVLAQIEKDAEQLSEKYPHRTYDEWVEILKAEQKKQTSSKSKATTEKERINT